MNNRTTIQRDQLVYVNTEEQLYPIQLAVTCSAATQGRAMRAPEVSVRWMEADGAAYVARGQRETIEVATILRTLPRDTWHLATHRGTRRYTLTDAALTIYNQCRSITVTTDFKLENENFRLSFLRDTVLQQANGPVAFPTKVYYTYCPICQEDELETPVTLTCGHQYCVNCLMGYLRSDPLLDETKLKLKEYECAMCSKPIRVADLLKMYAARHPQVTVEVSCLHPFAPVSTLDV